MQIQDFVLCRRFTSDGGEAAAVLDKQLRVYFSTIQILLSKSVNTTVWKCWNTKSALSMRIQSKMFPVCVSLSGPWINISAAFMCGFFNFTTIDTHVELIQILYI